LQRDVVPVETLGHVVEVDHAAVMITRKVKPEARRQKEGRRQKAEVKAKTNSKTEARSCNTEILRSRPGAASKTFLLAALPQDDGS
ncbi:MAG: hypothetical protein ABR517_04475, partial [Thermoanaerobaculia bacterium]